MKNDKFQKTNILDCTIRDSGYLNDWNWSYETVKDFILYGGDRHIILRNWISF